MTEHPSCLPLLIALVFVASNLLYSNLDLFGGNKSDRGRNSSSYEREVSTRAFLSSTTLRALNTLFSLFLCGLSCATLVAAVWPALFGVTKTNHVDVVSGMVALYPLSKGIYGSLTRQRLWCEQVHEHRHRHRQKSETLHLPGWEPLVAELRIFGMIACLTSDPDAFSFGGQLVVCGLFSVIYRNRLVSLKNHASASMRSVIPIITLTHVGLMLTLAIPHLKSMVNQEWQWSPDSDETDLTTLLTETLATTLKDSLMPVGAAWGVFRAQSQRGGQQGKEGQSRGRHCSVLRQAVDLVK